jgi:hypothetical protein
MAESDEGIGYAQSDMSVLERVDQRLVVNISMERACDMELVTASLDLSAPDMLDIYYYPRGRGLLKNATITLAVDGNVLERTTVRFQATSWHLYLSLDELEGGTLTLEINSTDSPDLDLSNNRRSWAVTKFSGENEFTGNVDLGDVCILDGARLSFKGCGIDLPGNMLIAGMNRSSTMDISNCTIRLSALSVIGNLSGNINDSIFLVSRDGQAEYSSYVSFGGDNWSFAKDDFMRADFGSGTVSAYISGENSSVTGCRFSNFTEVGIECGSVANTTFEECKFPYFFIKERLIGCNISAYAASLWVSNPNCTIRNNNISIVRGSPYQFNVYGPVNISRFASENTFLNLSGTSIKFTKKLTIILNASWLQNITSEEVRSLQVEIIGLEDYIEPVYGYLNPQTGEWQTYPEYMTIGLINASGASEIHEIYYDMQIVTISGDMYPFSGKLEFQDGRDQEYILR